MAASADTDAPIHRNEMPSSGVDRAKRARVEALLRVHAQARAEAYADALAAMRRRLRGYVAGLALLSFGVGVVVGVYGRPLAHLSAGPGSTPVPTDLPPVFTEVPAAGVESLWPLRVYVSGAVTQPRVVTVPAGSLVADVLEAAGGPCPEADLEALNLAATVADGQHVVVPTRLATATMPHALIDLNGASAAELESLPYIGASRAAEIVAYREAHGPFREVEDLLAVPGIGPTIYAHIESLVTVEP